MTDIKNLLNTLPLNIVIYRYKDGDFIFIEFNKMAENTEKIDKSKLIGKKLTELFPGVKEFGLFDILLDVEKNGLEKELDISFYEDERVSGWRHNIVNKLDNGDLIVTYHDMSVQKKLEKDLFIKNRELEDAQKIANLGSWTLDIKTDEVSWSDEVYRILGEEPQSFSPSYEKFLSYLDEKDKTLLHQHVNRAIENRSSYNFEHKILRKDNSIRYVQESASLTYDSSNNPMSMTATVLDITDKKRHELKEQERYKKTKKYQSALLQWAQVDYNNLDDALKEATKISSKTLDIQRSSIWLYKDDDSILECIWLYSNNKSLNSIGDTIEAKKYPLYFQALKKGKTLAINDAQHHPITSEFNDDYLIPLNIKSMLDTPIIDSGKLIGVVCNENVENIKEWQPEDIEFSHVISTNISLALEIDRRKEAENKLLSLGSIIDNTLNEIYIFDALTLHFTYINDAAKNNIGYSFEEITQLTPVDIKPEYNKFTFLEILQPLANNEEEFLIFETTHQRKDFTTYRVEIQLQKMILNSKEQYVVTAHDISLRKQAQLQIQESEEKFRNIAENTLMGIFIYQDKYIYANDAAANMLGYTLSELYALHPWEIIEKKYQEEISLIIKRRLTGELFTKEHSDINIVTKHGKTKIMRITTQTIKYKGSYAGMGTIIDITDIKQTKKQLQSLGQAIEQMDELVRITDNKGIITYVNEALVAHVGYKKSELIGKNINIFRSGQQDKAFYKNLWETITSGQVFRGVFINLTKNKQFYYEDTTISPILDEKGDIQNYVSTSKDITQRVLTEKRLKKLTTIDSLTGIYNRYKVNEEIDSEIIRNSRYKGSFVLCMIDIDHFKSVNDTYGHDIGDYVLKEVSSLTLKSIRASDKFGRWGGEEFILLLPNIEKESALEFVNKIRNIISNHNYKDVNKITVSIGLSQFMPNDTKETLLKRVDNALYQAKLEGRNRSVLL